MPQNSISAQLSNLQQLVADLEAIENGGKKAISNTIKETSVDKRPYFCFLCQIKCNTF